MVSPIVLLIRINAIRGITYAKMNNIKLSIIVNISLNALLNIDIFLPILPF